MKLHYVLTITIQSNIFQSYIFAFCENAAQKQIKKKTNSDTIQRKRIFILYILTIFSENEDKNEKKK